MSDIVDNWIYLGSLGQNLFGKIKGNGTWPMSTQISGQIIS